MLLLTTTSPSICHHCPFHDASLSYPALLLITPAPHPSCIAETTGCRRSWIHLTGTIQSQPRSTETRLVPAESCRLVLQLETTWCRSSGWGDGGEQWQWQGRANGCSRLGAHGSRSRCTRTGPCCHSAVAVLPVPTCCPLAPTCCSHFPASLLVVAAALLHTPTCYSGTMWLPAAVLGLMQLAWPAPTLGTGVIARGLPLPPLPLLI